MVEIKRAGDVIPYVTKIVKNNKNKFIIKSPNKCPVCKSETKKEVDEAVLRCTNKYGCYSQQFRANNSFYKQKSLNIDGFGEKQSNF